MLFFHRDGSDVFSVNALHFHPQNTFCSAGSDGVLSFWDKDARHRLANLEQFKRQSPITDVKFNLMVTTIMIMFVNIHFFLFCSISVISCHCRLWCFPFISYFLLFFSQGNMMFYSLSYDWSRGAENNDPKVKFFTFGLLIFSAVWIIVIFLSSLSDAQIENSIYVHSIQPSEVAPKDPKSLKK